MDDYSRLEEGQYKYCQPGSTLVSSPFKAVQQGEESSAGHRQEDEHPGDVDDPPRPGTGFLPLLAVLLLGHPVSHLRLHDDRLGNVVEIVPVFTILGGFKDFVS